MSPLRVKGEDVAGLTAQTIRIRPISVNRGRGAFFSVAADGVMFLIGATAVFVVKIGGDLPIAELLVAPLLPILLVTKGYRLRLARFKTIMILLALWYLGQVITDLYRQPNLTDLLHTHSRILMTAIDLLAMAMLISRNARRQALFFAGYAIGALLQVKLQPNDFTDFWKFGYSTGATISVVLVSCYFYYHRRYSILVLLLLTISAVHAAFNYRSPILFLFLTIVFVVPVIPERVGRIRILPAARGVRIVVLALMAIIAGEVASKLILYLGNSGYLGEEAREKNSAQAASKGGFLLGGRPEILVSSRAVMDSPILGHGSWAKDSKYVEMYQDILVEYGSEEHEEEDSPFGDLIPTHSHIMGAWVEAGILGAVFWGYIISLVVRGLIRTSLNFPPLAPIYAYMFAAFLWAIPFSPGGGITVLPESVLIIIACDLLEKQPTRFLGYAKPIQRKTPVRFSGIPYRA